MGDVSNATNAEIKKQAPHAVPSIQLHDILFHVLFGCDTEMMAEFVHAAGCRLYSLTGVNELARTLKEVVQNRNGIGVDRLRALFFLFLNMDMPLKEYVCDPGSVESFAAALNIPMDEAVQRHSYSMVGTKPLSKEKARRFVLEMREICKAWLSKETSTCSDFVGIVRQEYLVS